MMFANIAHLQPRRVLLLIAIGLLGIIGGRFVATQGSSPPAPAITSAPTHDQETSPHDSNAFFLPAPDTLGPLVEKADIIVVGTVGEKLQQQWFWGYDEQGGMIKAKDKNLPPEAETLFHDFLVHVEEVIKDDGRLQAQKPLILRTLFERATPNIDPSHHYPGIFPGDRYLMFLTLNPDRTTYGFYYAMASRITINGPVVTQSDGARSPLPFAKNVAPQEFLRQLRQAVR